MRPPFPYFGAKQTLADDIVALLPDHEHYVEPFCGSLSVLLAKSPARMETVNDLDQQIVTFWRVLRDQPEDLARVCALTPHSRLEYETETPDSAPDDLEAARRTWLRLTQGRGGTLRASKTGWRYYVMPRGSSIGMPGYLAGYVDRMSAAAQRLQTVSLECGPAIELVEKYGRAAETLLYIDPPYLASTRGWGNNYQHEMKDDASHRELAEALRAARAAVVISGYPSPCTTVTCTPTGTA
jgi:DNA adenine methylase